MVAGTSGESATLRGNEYEELIRFSVREVNHRMKVIAGIGSNNTALALRKAEDAKFLGADAVLMLPPYYNKTNHNGIIEHFSYVADRVNIPMILYNVPSRTVIGIDADFYKILSEHPNINGVKEASSDISLVSKIRTGCGDMLNIWSGNDDNTIAMMAMGAKGVISVASNIIPAVVSKICSLCGENNFVAATELFGKYSDLVSALFIETNPIPIKTAMKLLGSDSGEMRLPLTNMAEENLLTLRSKMRDAGLNV